MGPHHPNISGAGGAATADPMEALLREARAFDWICGCYAVIGVVMLAMCLARPDLMRAPWVATVIASAAMVGGLAIPRMARLRNVRVLRLYLLSLHGMVIALALSNGLGIRTPALMYLPITLFVLGALTSVRQAVTIALVCGLSAAALVLGTPPIDPVPGLPTDGVLATILVVSQMLAVMMGSILGNLLRQALLRSSQHAEQRYQTLFRQVPSPLILHRHGEILEANAAAARLLGYPSADAMRRGDYYRHFSAPSKRLMAERARDLQEAQPGDVLPDTHYSLVTLDGREVKVRSSASRLMVDGSDSILSSLLDETERLSAQTSMRSAQRTLRSIVETSPYAIVLTDLMSSHILLCNAAYAASIGRDARHIEGSRALDLDVWVDPGQRERLVAQVQAGQGVVEEVIAVRRLDGQERRIRTSVALIEPDGRPALLMIGRDVTEEHARQQQREAWLMKAREDALAASQAKSDFLATMSHEIRNPLNGVLGLADLAADPLIDDQQRQRYVRLIGEAAQALREIVSDVLDISRIESGHMELETMPFDLQEWLAGLQAAYSALAEAKGLMLRLDAPAEHLGHVRGDPTRLRQVLVNYLTNALKFTFQGTITVTVRRLSPQRVKFAVTDTGVGLDHEEQQVLFAPFVQARASTARRFGGSGLGLSICREIVRLMGGTVGLHSEPGLGSTFWAEVELPQVSAPAPRRPVAGRAELHGLRVLLVDDNEINRLVGSSLLGRAGADVDVAGDGRAAIDAVMRAHGQARPYDLVFMDVQMPTMDGLAATRAIRSTSAGRGLRIVALTAAALQAEVDAALAAGMDHFIPKPLDLARIIDLLRPAPETAAHA